MLTEVFLSFLVSSAIACILTIAQYMYKSKCDQIKCGCISIHRVVDLENQDTQQPVELPAVLRPPERRTPSLDNIGNIRK
jgi:hypothetical protein